MPASIAGLLGRAGRSGFSDVVVDAPACEPAALPCAGGVCRGARGKTPWLPLWHSCVGRFAWKNVNEKIDFGGFARRNFPLWLR